MITKTIYIAGPITGVYDYMEKFDFAEKRYTDLDFNVINPARLFYPLRDIADHNQLMELSFQFLSFADCICMLKGWENSKGALMEYGFARAKGLRIYHL